MDESAIEQELADIKLTFEKACEGQDSNPRTSTGADLKSAAFGQAQPPSRSQPIDDPV